MEEVVCSVTECVEIVGGGWGDYEALSGFHYRGDPCRVYSAIYAMRDAHPVRGRFGGLVGVIVYTMPSIGLELRNVATGGMFSGFGDRGMGVQMLNERVRCISRVIIEPRYRGLGLASRLVRETMELAGVAIVESMAAMGGVNPFLEKAGMKAYRGKTSRRCVQLAEALGVVGVGEEMFVDPGAVEGRLACLEGESSAFIEREIGRFLQAYGKRKFMSAGIERTRFVLSKLGGRPTYYIWFRDEQGMEGENE